MRTAMLIALLNCIIVSSALAQGEPSVAQDKKKLSYRSFMFRSPRWEFGAGVGISNSFTDMAPRVAGTQPDFTAIYIQGFSPAASFHTRYRATTAFGAKASVGAVMLKGRDSWSPDEEVVARNKSFTNTLFEFNLLGEIYLPKRNLRPKPDFTYRFRDIWFFSGLSAFYHFPEVSGPIIDEYDESLLTTDDIYNNFQLAVPIGMGMQWTLSNKWVFGWDFNFRYTFFDYLDGFKRPNSTRNDHFFTIGLNVGYIPTRDVYRTTAPRVRHIFVPGINKF
jgi:hypothetical protein